MERITLSNRQEQEVKTILVVGVVNRDSIKKGVSVIPESELNNGRYTFFEIDTADKETHEFVMQTYATYKINVIVHRLNHGYHYFGDRVPIQTWREWYELLKPLNKDYPPLTLRVTRKRDNELWCKPEYVQNNDQDKANWVKAVLYFLNRELRFENTSTLWNSVKRCGLEKYFKVVVYPVEVVQS